MAWRIAAAGRRLSLAGRRTRRAPCRLCLRQQLQGAPPTAAPSRIGAYVAADMLGHGPGTRLLAASSPPAGRGFRQMVAVIGDQTSLHSRRLHCARASIPSAPSRASPGSATAGRHRVHAAPAGRRHRRATDPGSEPSTRRPTGVEIATAPTYTPLGTAYVPRQHRRGAGGDRQRPLLTRSRWELDEQRHKARTQPDEAGAARPGQGHPRTPDRAVRRELPPAAAYQRRLAEQLDIEPGAELKLPPPSRRSRGNRRCS